MKTKNILEQNREQVIADYLGGKNTTELGRIYNCNGGSIYVFLRDNGVEMRKATNLEDCRETLTVMFNAGKSSYAIAKELGMNGSTVERYLKTLGFNLSSRKLNHDIPIKVQSKEIIKDYLNGNGCTILSQKYKCSETAILNILTDNNIETRPLREYALNERFFEKIDTPEKAYILGLFFADGNNDTTQFRIFLIDKELIEKVKITFEYSGPIKVIQPRQPTHQIQYGLNLCSTKLCIDAAKCGCIPNKTFITRIPSLEILPHYLIRHFLRGVFDGDGTVSYYKKKNKYGIGYVGPADFMEDIKKFLVDNLGITGSICRPSKNTTNSIRQLNFGGNLQVKAFLDWLYKDSTIHLNRKYDRYLELCRLLA